jgi:hypothetical protein
MTPQQIFTHACKIALAHPELSKLPLQKIFNRLGCEQENMIAKALAQHFVALALSAAETVDSNSKSISIGEQIRRASNMKDVTP